MTSANPFATARCPECGAEYPEQGARCWLCGSPLPAEAPAGEAAALPAESAAAPPVPQWTFGLSSLMLVTTLVAVCLGLGSIAPGLGIVLAIVSAPALVRTFVASARRKASGERLTPAEKLTAFFGSVGVVVIVGISAAIAFYATCWIACGAAAAVGADEGAFLVGIVVGVLVGIVVLVLMLRWLWPLRGGNRKTARPA